MMPRHALAVILTIVLAGPVAAGEQPGFMPAEYVNGELPAAPVLAVSGGEVFLEVIVAEDGHVDSIRPLRVTPPFTDAAINAVRLWRFKPATEAVAPTSGQPAGPPEPVAGPVLVAAMFTPPALNGPTAGQPPQDVAAPSGDTSMPITVVPAIYPPRAVGDGAVLVDVSIDAAGTLTDARVVVPAPAFDAAALAAARSWSFRAARRRGNPVAAHAYLLFVFRQPVIGR
jgi:TonB family protein